MKEDQLEINTEKNSNLSVVLIVVNLMLTLVFMFSVADDHEEAIFTFLTVMILILLGGYAFTYHGKKYRIGKWLFGIAVLLALIFFGLLYYVTQLGKAFAH